MKIVIRADASTWIGSGHIMRCLALSDSLKFFGHQVSFSSIPQPGDMIDLIKERGYSVLPLSSPKSINPPKHDADYLGWLLRSVHQDADDFLQHVTQADIIIVDHYGIDYQWHEKVRAQLNCKIVAIDDLIRKHSADLIIDSTISRCGNEYQPHFKIITGSAYALLNKQFSQARELALNRKPPKQIINVLVSMGGIDKENVTLKILKAMIGNIHASVKITVLLSPRAPHYHTVADFCALYTSITHIDFSPNIADLMLSHDVAIGAPGTSAAERACLGLPSIIIPQAENQQENSKQLQLNKAAICIEIDQIQSKFLAAFDELILNWLSFYDANIKLCDGLGIYRATREIQKLYSASLLELKNATLSDISLIYEWQQHPNTRKYALNTSIPTWEEHKLWMANKLKSLTDKFYLIKDVKNNIPVGTIRLDREKPSNYIISIFIAPKYYGNSYANEALRILDTIHPNIFIHAVVKPENIASQKLFEKSNYLRISENKFLRPPIIK
ncbi:UDP-2,4-diacetamido-2,4,6-trideoxy-beta-L-altropyranose hydrolase [Photorhabdus sp. RM323S]|uniref:UDP-2,4-diacetamido-2,4, 6-trideoxy-beta-L-altropyranose hydrolase n=1 Tax=Photorhabdus sp. RM323S TaxID=3342828 RepID=UPI0036DD699A